MALDAAPRPTEPSLGPALGGRPADGTAAGAAAAPLWHALSADEALAAAGSGPAGLAEGEAQRRLRDAGPNVIPRAGGDGPLRLLWRQVHHPLIYVLLASAALAAVMGKPIDGAVVLGVVVVNTLIGFVQEYRAGKAIEALIDMVPEGATVVRDGARRTVPAATLVPGDVVALQSGDKVPADARLLALRGLQIDEAALTGESVPVAKATAPLPGASGLGDRRNLAYGGTLVTSGTGTAVVVATGGATELGRISALLRTAAHLETPLTRQLAVVGRWLTGAIVALSGALFVVGLLRGYAVLDAALAGITLAVGAIPEGLPAVITIALAIGVQRMARRRAVIRRLPAVETLGSTTVICSDKTGTLTRNEMTVQEVWTPEGRFRLSGVGYAPEGTLARAGESPPGPGGSPREPGPDGVRELLLAGALCSDATLLQEDGAWHVAGDPTEGALVVAARKAGLDAEAARAGWPRLDAIPFESERQYMATLHAAPEGGQAIYLKGAPEAVLGRCGTRAGGAPLHAAAAHDEVEALAAQGMRVLALAVRRPVTPLAALHEADVAAGFELLGLQGMIDPPRPEAVAAVRACREAGIAVKMITGDHRVTAQAIGQRLGLLGPGERAVPGGELDGLPDEALEEVAGRVNVFARVAPEHKLRLVEALQRRGQVVAMTGDGVNDAPALKQADVGVAMGITGTAVSKEAADVVLADDNFASIAAAVEEGRRVYDNLIKALAFILPTNIGLAVILVAAVAFFPIVGGEPLLPMRPVQILWINLVAAVALALPLAFEVMERDVMRRAPRRPDAPVLGRFVAVRTVVVALLMAAGALGLFLYEYFGEVGRGVDAAVALREAQTMAVTTVILFQIFYVLDCRSLKESLLRIGLWSNPTIWLGIGALALLQLAFIYLPVMHLLFGSAPLAADALLKSLLVALVVLPVVGAEKWWRGRA